MRTQPIPIPLDSGYYKSESLSVANKEIINLRVNIPDGDATSPAQLFNTDGLTQLEDTGIGNANRGAHVMADTPYFVNGGTLWRYDRTIDALGNEIFNLVNAGSIAGTGRVSMADSGTQLCIVVPGTATAYIYTVSGGLVQITDPAFIPSPAASVVYGVRFVSGYFVFHADNGVVFHSQPNDGTSYNALDFFVYENAKNEVVGIHEYKDQLFVFSDETSAVYAATNITSSGSAFVKVQGYDFSKGLTSQFAVFDFNGSFVMIGQGVNESPKIYIFNGNDFTAISNTSIEQELQRYSTADLSEAFGYNYTSRGAIYASFNLRNNSFFYDAKASELSGKKCWHQRRSQNLADKDRLRVNSLVTAYGRLLVGDSERGIIGQMSPDVYTEYGEKIHREFSVITSDSKGVLRRHCAIKMGIEAGLSSYADEAEISLRYSDDNKIFTQFRSRGCGSRGQYIYKLQWVGFDATRTARTYNFRMSDPVKYVIRDLVLEVL